MKGQPFEIFISYRTSDSVPDANGIKNLLDTNDFKKYIGPDLRVFKDNRTIKSGQDWAEEIDHHSCGCKVLLLCVGPDWVKELEQRAGNENFDPEYPIDWVRKELRNALGRDGITPAKLLIIRDSESTMDTANLGQYFTHAKDENVRKTLQTRQYQELIYDKSVTKEALFEAVANIWHAPSPYDTSSETGNRTEKQTSPANCETWVKYIGREEQWNTLRETMGVHGPYSMQYEREDAESAVHALATMWHFQSLDDNPDALAEAVSFYFQTRGELHQHRVRVEPRYSKFSFPKLDSDLELFREFASKNNLGNEIPMLPEDSAAKSPADSSVQPSLGKLIHHLNRHFVTGFVKHINSSAHENGTCYIMRIDLERKQSAHIKAMAQRFCDVWNHLDWSALGYKVFVVFALVGVPKAAPWYAFFSRSSKQSDLGNPIGRLTQNCFLAWRDDFIHGRIRPDSESQWVTKIDSFEWNKPMSFKEMEDIFKKQNIL